MEETKIAFETAKLAREVGFNFGCAAFFKEELGGHPSEGEVLIDYNMHKGYISRPSQSILAKWLRDVHNWHIEVCAPDLPNQEWYGHIRQPSVYGNRGDIEKQYSFEDVLEAGLQKVLRILQNENKEVE